MHQGIVLLSLGKAAKERRSGTRITHTGVRIPLGTPTKTRLEHRGIAVEEFLQMIRFDQRDKLAELPGELLRERSR
ncbi:MAG: hypothetical protein WBF05_15455 [Anaerolineales bacterium]